MSDAAISIRISPSQDKNHEGQKEHDERIKTPGYADSSKHHLNDILIQTPSSDSLRKELEARRAKFKRQKLRKDARLSYCGIITFSRSAQSIINALPRKEQNELYMKAAQAIAVSLKVELIGLSVHRDESAPHAHFTLESYTADAIAIDPKKRDLSTLQDAGAGVYAHLGIKRGKRIGERISDGDPLSQIINRNVKQLHDDLPREIEEAKAKLKEAKEMADKIENDAQLKARQYMHFFFKCKKTIERLKARLPDIESEITEELTRLEEETNSSFASIKRLFSFK